MTASGEASMGTCPVHSGKAVTFQCAHCKKSYCPDCLGREEAGQTICNHCMIDVNHREKEELARAVEVDIKEKKISAKKAMAKQATVNKKSSKWVFYAIIIPALIGVGFNLYILYQDRTQSAGADVVRTPSMSSQLAGIRHCRHNITALSKAVAVYQSDLGEMPDGLEDLTPRLDSKDITRDPLTGLEYSFVRDADEGLVIQCPSPEKHGVESIHAQPGKAAIVEYMELVE